MECAIAFPSTFYESRLLIITITLDGEKKLIFFYLAFNALLTVLNTSADKNEEGLNYAIQNMKHQHVHILYMT